MTFLEWATDQAAVGARALSDERVVRWRRGSQL